MKKSVAFLFVTQLCTLNGMQDEANVRVPLPAASIVQRTIGRFIFKDFFTKTLVLDQLAEKNKSKQEIVEVLTSCANLYFKKTDQPAGRDFFSAQINKIAQALVEAQHNQATPIRPQHSCKLHANITTHEHLNPSPNSKL